MSAVRFGRLLRERGLAVAPEQAARWVRAVQLLGMARPADLYWCGRLTLTRGRSDLPIYDAAFRDFWLDMDAGAIRRAEGRPREDGPVGGRLGRVHDVESAGGATGREDASSEPSGRVLPGMESWLRRSTPLTPGDGGEAADSAREEAAFGLYSRVEVLREKDFASYTDEDRVALDRWLKRVEALPPELVGRRRVPAVAGRELDVRRTVGWAARRHGDPVRLHFRQRRRRFRKWVFLCDVSASMAPYSLGMLAFLRALVGRRPATEVFVFGTGLTRLTPHLRRARAQDLRPALEAVRDFGGGTRLGQALQMFRRRWGQRGFAHGALLVVISDGLDCGDVATVDAELRRLKRLVHALAWVNPLKRSPAYEPLAQAMAAALPHVDDFVSGHNLASLVGLLERRATSEVREGR